tara:strand:+ start:11846 stop:12904 length:1059 start_codon:yes stop_codon:yes gene_type:complete
MKINLGIIGCGRVAEHHKKYLKTFRNVKIISCCDKKLVKAKSFADFYKSNFETDYLKILHNNDINTVIISTESGNHFKHAKEALINNKHTIVEKPITFNQLELKKLIILSKKKNLMLTTLFQNRFNKSIQYLKGLVDKNKLGIIVQVKVNLVWCRFQDYYNDKWHGTWSMDGGVINQQAIHHVDILNWIFGPIKKITSYNKNILNILEAEDTSVNIFETKDNVLGTISATTSARPKDFEASIEVISEKGIIKIGGIGLNRIINLNLKNIKNKKIVEIKKKYSQNFKQGYGESHGVLFKKIFDNILINKYVSPVDLDSVMETLTLVNSIYLSNQINKSINIKSKNIFNKLGKR